MRHVDIWTCLSSKFRMTRRHVSLNSTFRQRARARADDLALATRARELCSARTSRQGRAVVVCDGNGGAFHAAVRQCEAVLVDAVKLYEPGEASDFVIMHLPCEASALRAVVRGAGLLQKSNAHCLSSEHAVVSR